jgi:hypothetical protein
MKIRHNRRERLGLSAAIMTRDVACGMYPPGSDGWNRWSCGAVAPTPSPPSSSQQPSAPPAPPSVVNIDYDAEYARRVQAATNERIAAQLVADQQSKLAAEESAKAAAARSELDTLRANAAASMSATEAGGVGYGFSTSSGSEVVSSDADDSKSGMILSVLAALGLVALLARGKSK